VNEFSLGSIIENADKINARYEEAKAMHTEEYLRGAGDCKAGRPAKTDAHPDYNRGYGKQYEFEQVKTEMSDTVKKWK